MRLEYCVALCLALQRFVHSSVGFLVSLISPKGVRTHPYARSISLIGVKTKDIKPQTG